MPVRTDHSAWCCLAGINGGIVVNLFAHVSEASQNGPLWADGALVIRPPHLYCGGTAPAQEAVHSIPLTDCGPIPCPRRPSSNASLTVKKTPISSTRTTGAWPFTISIRRRPRTSSSCPESRFRRSTTWTRRTKTWSGTYL